MLGPPLPLNSGCDDEPPTEPLLDDHPVFDDWDLDVLLFSVEEQDALVVHMFTELGCFRCFQRRIYSSYTD
jgi:hypothetical protein